MPSMKFPLCRKDLLWCASLILFSVAGYWIAGRVFVAAYDSMPLWLLQRLLNLTMLCLLAAAGAGIGALFKRKLVGAVIGDIALVVFWVVTSSLVLNTWPDETDHPDAPSPELQQARIDLGREQAIYRRLSDDYAAMEDHSPDRAISLNSKAKILAEQEEVVFNLWEKTHKLTTEPPTAVTP
jgi:hypothetical protein